MGSFMSAAVVEAQFNYQQNISNSILLVYDPLKSQNGSIAVKAYRLSDKFMSLYKERKFTRETLAQGKVSVNDIFIELPITIKNNGLTDMVLAELDSSEDYTALNFVTDPVMEKNLELLSDCLDDHAQDQYKWNRFLQFVTRQQQSIMHQTLQREKENKERVARGLDPLPMDDVAAAMKPVHEPSRLENLLLHNQMQQYCDNIKQFADTTRIKLQMSEHLQKIQ
jgi:translation initiation factor 3 subunit H